LYKTTSCRIYLEVYSTIMKILIILLLFFNYNFVYANKDMYILSSHYKTDSTVFNFSDNNNYSTWSMKGSWTDNFSNFGTVNCVGQAQKSAEDSLSIYGVCEIKDEKKLRKWWTIERNIGVTELGVGKSVQLAAEGYWSVLNGTNCNYAIKHGEEYSYSITKCKITSQQSNDLNKKVN